MIARIKCLFGFHQFKPFTMTVSRMWRVTEANEYGFAEEVHAKFDVCGMIRFDHDRYRYGNQTEVT